MSKRQSFGRGRKAPESDQQREMRRALENANRGNRRVDNRSLIPQLMRELTEVQRLRRSAFESSQRESVVVSQPTRRVQSLPVPPRELPPDPLRVQMALPGPSSQDGHRATDPGRNTSEFVETYRPAATRKATPFPDEQVSDSDEDIEHGEMTVSAEVHQTGSTELMYVPGGQLQPQGSKYLDLQEEARQFPAEPLYAVPHKNDDTGSTRSPTLSSASLSNRPPTPHPRTWLPFQVDYVDQKDLKNIYGQQGFDRDNENGINYMLTKEDKYNLNTKMAMQRSLRESFEIANAQYVGSDCTAMMTRKCEEVTSNEPGMLVTCAPKPARLYVRGVNAPPGMMEPIASIVPRVANVQCPPPSPEDEIWETIIPSPTNDAQQDLTSQQQSNTICESFMKTFMNGIQTVGQCLHFIHCRVPIPGPRASN